MSMLNSAHGGEGWRPRAASMAAEFAEGKGRAAAEIFRNVNAAAHGDIGAEAWARHIAELQHLPGLDGDRLPAALEREAQRLAQVHDTRAQLHLSAREPVDVEKIVDQVREVSRLPLDDRALALRGRRVRLVRCR